MVLTVSRNDAGYEELRSRYFNARLPDLYPAKIACPQTTQDVVQIVKEAKQQKRKIGVRSGGHLFPACSLVEDGVLINTRTLNSSIDYDETTKVLSFGSGCLSHELATFCDSINRFFPFGHSPTVGIGGFLLCGGQGWFMRGWGNTADSWIVKVEVVTPDGSVVEASREHNQDLFWAMRGSGQGFFGVVTRIWGRTMPARRIFESTIVFNATTRWDQVCRWVFDTNDRTPKYGVETAVATCYADKNAPGELGDDVQDNNLIVVVVAMAYADSIEEATTMIREYEKVPREIEDLLIVRAPLTEKTWEQVFADQDALNPTGNGERWQCDSILNDPTIPRDKLIATIQPAMCDLPTRRSVGCIYIADYYPDERDMALSLAQQYYISTMTCWTDSTRDDSMRQWMHDAYTRASNVAVGQYIADFDASHRLERIMTQSALTKWLEVRARWDPDEVFVGYKGFAATLKEGNVKNVLGTNGHAL